MKNINMSYQPSTTDELTRGDHMLLGFLAVWFVVLVAYLIFILVTGSLLLIILVFGSLGFASMMGFWGYYSSQ
jgi:hypothetical protein